MAWPNPEPKVFPKRSSANIGLFCPIVGGELALALGVGVAAEINQEEVVGMVVGVVVGVKVPMHG